MHSAGARVLRADDNEMSREAVLLQWEQKIEAAERREEEGRAEEAASAAAEDATHAEASPAGPESRPSGRFARSTQSSDSPTAGRPALQLVEPEGIPSEPRFQRAIDPPELARERRTITITGQPTPARRRRSLVDAQIANPDRIALWAFLLGLFLVAVAAGTAHA